MNFTKTIINAIQYWVNNNFFSHENIATDDEVIDSLLAVDMLPVVSDEDGSILVDKDNSILLI